MKTATETLTRRERERFQRVELILDAAEKLFLEKGFAATTMNDIGEAAEFSRASLYHYFPSKESIYVAILERGMDTLLSEIREKIDAVAGAARKLVQLKDILLSFVQQRQNFFRLYFITRTEVMPYLGDKLARRLEVKTKELDGIFHEIYRQGMKNGEFRPGDPSTMGDIFFAQLIGLIVLNTTEKLEPPLMDNVDKATAFFLENIRAK